MLGAVATPRGTVPIRSRLRSVYYNIVKHRCQPWRHKRQRQSHRNSITNGFKIIRRNKKKEISVSVELQKSTPLYSVIIEANIRQRLLEEYIARHYVENVVDRGENVVKRGDQEVLDVVEVNCVGD